MQLISIIVPAHNEEKNIPLIFSKLRDILLPINNYNFEIVFVNDGSLDNTYDKMVKLNSEERFNVKLIDFSRNFGKEIALTAGLNICSGDAAIMIDADLQHPPELIPEFIKKWEDGCGVVVGVRNTNKKDSIFKKFASLVFNKILKKISNIGYTSRSTDFRLLDRGVIDEFNNLKESNRMTRGLIDWLGFKRGYIFFDAAPRINGKRSYSIRGLARLFINGLIQNSLLPLKLAGYFGVFITLISGVLGFAIIISRYILESPWGMSITRTVILAILNVFLIGIVLSSLGLVALYIANISNESKGRPLYIVNKKTSKNIL